VARESKGAGGKKNRKFGRKTRGGRGAFGRWKARNANGEYQVRRVRRHLKRHPADLRARSWLGLHE